MLGRYTTSPRRPRRIAGGRPKCPPAGAGPRHLSRGGGEQLRPAWRGAGAGIAARRGGRGGRSGARGAVVARATPFGQTCASAAQTRHLGRVSRSGVQQVHTCDRARLGLGPIGSKLCVRESGPDRERVPVPHLCVDRTESARSGASATALGHMYSPHAHQYRPWEPDARCVRAATGIGTSPRLIRGRDSVGAGLRSSPLPRAAVAERLVKAADIYSAA